MWDCPGLRFGCFSCYFTSDVLDTVLLVELVIVAFVQLVQKIRN